MIFYLTILSTAYAAAGATPGPSPSPLASSLTEFGAGSVDFTALFVKMVAAMVIVIALAVLSIRYVIPKMAMLRSRGGTESMRVVDRMPLDARKAVYIVEVEGRRLLIGVSENHIGFLAELTGGKDDDDRSA